MKVERTVSEEQDEWSLRSHQRAVAATDAGMLAEEIVGVKVPGKKGEVEYVESDESLPGSWASAKR